MGSARPGGWRTSWVGEPRVEEQTAKGSTPLDIHLVDVRVDFAHALWSRVEQVSNQASLTPRERQVLELMLLGRSMGEIGTTLGITARTARFHQANVLEKIGADSRIDLVRVLL